MAHDTTSNPVTLDIDLVTPFTDFIENLQTFIPLTQTTSVSNGSVTTNIGGRTWQTVTDFTDTTNSLGVDPNSVPINNTSQVRKSLSFNCIPSKGLGLEEDLTEFKL